MTTYPKFTYEAIETSPAEMHVHCTRVIKGERYSIAKTDDPNYVSITGVLCCKSGGKEKVYDKHIHIQRVKPFVKLIK